MRGSAIDAECPRCGHKQPPGDAIVTCARCGLAYPPKEILRAVPKRREEEALPALRPPPSIVVDEVGDHLTFRWSLYRTSGIATTLVALVVAAIVVASAISTGDKVGYLVFLAGLAIYGAHRARRQPRVSLDRDRVTGLTGPILLADIQEIAVARNGVLALMRVGDRRPIAWAPDEDAAAFVADAVARRLPGFVDEN